MCATDVDAVSANSQARWKKGINDVPKNDALDRALKFDAIKTAEEICEYNCADSQALGFLLHLGNSVKKKEILGGSGDTHFNMKFADMIRCAESIGFDMMLLEPFDADNRKDVLAVMFHDAGILLKFDSYDERVNGSEYFANWQPHDYHQIHKEGVPKLTASGIWHPSPQEIKEGRGTEDDWYWAGMWDAREAMKYTLLNLQEYGQFLNPWRYDVGLNLCHYMDWREIGKLPYPASSERCKEITMGRLGRLPRKVSEAVVA